MIKVKTAAIIISNFLIQVNIVSFPADKVLYQQRPRREPASGGGGALAGHA